MEPLAQLLRSLESARRGAHLNREGAPSFVRDLREQTVQVLTTGTLSNTFYATREELAREAIDVLVRARHECPAFLARAIVWAREHGYLKTLPALGLAILSGGRGRTKELFAAAFPRVIRTPDDLRAFVVLCRSGVIPGRTGLGGVARAAVRAQLATISEYHAVKYGSAASRVLTLRDILRLAHPKPQTPAAAERLGWLATGAAALGPDQNLNPRIRALEALKAAADEERLALVRQGNLPYEAVVPAARTMSPALWVELLRQAPYLNLVRSLATFARHGVFGDEANVRLAIEKLTDPAAIERSRVLPFRFFDAWKRYAGSAEADTRIADALREALDRSFGNLPPFGDRAIAIGTDVSGSMDSPISEKGTTRFIDIAGVFTGALLRRIEGRAIPLPFDTVAHSACGLSPRDDILVTAEKVARLMGGGTAIGAPIEHLLALGLRVDAFIGITDHEEWAFGDGYACQGSFLDLWRQYRSEVAPESQAFLVTIAPYRDAVAPAGEAGVHFLYGWSDAVLTYIALALEAGPGQIEAIEAMPLG